MIRSMLSAAAIITLAQLSFPGRPQNPIVQKVAQPENQAILTVVQRDFAKLDICALVPGQEVAEALGGSLRGEPSSNRTAGMYSRCTYNLELEGENVILILDLSIPQFWDDERAGEETAQDLPGLGDAAYTTAEPVNPQHTVHKVRILKRDDVQITATAETLEQAETLAKLAFSRL